MKARLRIQNRSAGPEAAGSPTRSAPLAGRIRYRRTPSPQDLVGLAHISWKWTILGAVVGLLAFSSPAHAQRGPRAVPAPDYFLAVAQMQAGGFREAIESLRDAASGGIRSTEGRWIDSICYHARLGECHYHLGDLPAAMEQYNSAARLFLTHASWLLRVQFPNLEPDQTSRGSNITWGRPTRPVTVGRFPDTLLTQQGRLDNENVLRHGGVAANPELYPIRASEIAYCTALALRRRRELMGSTCAQDPLTQALVEALARRPAPPNSWGQTWVSVWLGLAYSSAGQTQQAIAELQRGLLAANAYDHPLTATALLEMGKLAMERNQHEAAATFFYEATFPAVAFSQPDIVEEAFRLGSDNFLATAQKGVYPLLEAAIEYARRRDLYRHTAASLLVAAADNFTARGDAARAARLLAEAQQTMRRTDMVASDVGARYYHQLALVSYLQGNLAAGDTALATMLAWQRNGSRWLFQIALADRLFTSGAVSPRVAENLFIELLREPTSKDWALNVREALSVTLTPHLLPLEHWFEVTLGRKDHERAIEITDIVRRHRFYSSLPMGGRLLTLRWLLEAPESVLPPPALLQRQDLLNRHPNYAAVSRQARTVRAELEGLPLTPGEDDLEAKERQAQLLKQLNELSAVQEVILRSLALRREPADLVFPPVRRLAEVQQQMAPGQIAFTYFATDRYVFGMAISREKFNGWQIEEPRSVTKQIADLLREMGHFEGNKAVDGKTLHSEAWKPISRNLLTLLTDNAPPEFWDSFDEVVFVPDSVLWYLPFDALHVGTDGDSQPLLAKVRVRYAPTISLIVPDARPRLRDGQTAVVAGKLFPRWREQEIQAAAEELLRAAPSSTLIADKLPAPSGLFAKLLDRVVVLDDVEQDARPYDYAPLQVDRGKPGSNLARWLELPWGGPDQIAAPGFHTPAENALRKPGTGDEIFLTACALYATGARTVLLSRWRTGGQTSVDLMREFVQELPFAPASVAWRRSVELLRANVIDPDLEPRVTGVGYETPVKADHPFFWAGYLLLDTGAAPTVPLAVP